MEKMTNVTAKNSRINWIIDDSGLLTISGQGRIPDFTQGNKQPAPWDHEKNLITSIVIKKGITEIGINAFRDCSNLKEVKLPKTLRRIHGYAFKNCSSLTSIRYSRKKWKYIYDNCGSDSFTDRCSSEEDTVIFGIESFLNVPWAKRKFRNYYISDDILHVCFSSHEKCIIPNGVRIIKKFAFANIRTDAIVFPNSLEMIEDFAFDNAIIQGKIVLPNELNHIGEYAFAGCSFQSIRFPKGIVPEAMKRRKAYLTDTDIILPLQGIPKLAPKWYAGLKDVKGSDCFRRIQILERNPIHHKDGTLTSIWDADYINIGEIMLRKIQTGGVLFCIIQTEGRVLETKAIYLTKVREDEKEFLIPCVYLMYPELTREGKVLPWRDSFTYFSRAEVKEAFDWENARLLFEKGTLRSLNPGVKEEWFYSRKQDGSDWTLTLDLLNLWHEWNPSIKIDTQEENIRNDRYRWFVRI